MWRAARVYKITGHSTNARSHQQKTHESYTFSNASSFLLLFFFLLQPRTLSLSFLYLYVAVHSLCVAAAVVGVVVDGSSISASSGCERNEKGVWNYHAQRLKFVNIHATDTLFWFELIQTIFVDSSNSSKINNNHSRWRVILKVNTFQHALQNT